MVVFGRDALRRVRMNREGKWEIHANAVEAPALAEDTPAEATSELAPAHDGPACQYCHTAFDDSHKIDKTLYRCPNPECRRLTYVTEEAPVATTSRWW